MTEAYKEFDYGAWFGEDINNQAETGPVYQGLAGVPVAPSLTRLHEAIHRITTHYHPYDLEEAGIDVASLLETKSEKDVLALLEDAGIEASILPSEAIFQVEREWECQPLSSFEPREFETLPNGEVIDGSAFNTHDFERDHPRLFNKAAYARQMVLKRVRDLALQYTSASSQQAREAVQELFRSGIVGRQLGVLEGLQKAVRATSSQERRQRLEHDIREGECLVMQCHAVWQKYAKNEDSQPSSLDAFPFNVREAVV